MDAKIIKLKTLTDVEHEQTDRVFLFREVPSDAQMARLAAIHDEVRLLAVFIREHTRESHEQGRAIIHLREAAFWAMEALRLEGPAASAARDMEVKVEGPVTVSAPTFDEVQLVGLLPGPGSV